MKQMAQIIVDTYTDFDIPVKMVDSTEGLRNYHFYIQPTKTTRMKSMSAYRDDLCYALQNSKVEIEAPIPDKKLVGITVPKKGIFPTMQWKEAVTQPAFLESAPLAVPLGVDEFGEKHLIDIARTPHMLIAGTTGSGKSAVIHSFISSLLAKHTPETLRFIMCDPKRLDLTLYNNIPHLLTPVITDAKKSTRALSWAVKEMERRYDILQSEQVQNIASYHRNVYQPAKEAWVQAGSSEATQDALPEAVPFIVIIIDEINDFMQSYPRELEASITRLAQMSRAVGIHVIIATQRPSVNVITGAIKANIPTRIAMSVASQVDSRTIIDQPGAEKLQGEGDMLYQAADSPRPVRLQSYFISEAEVAQRVARLVAADMIPGMEPLDLTAADEASAWYGTQSADGSEDDDLYEDARQAVIEAGKASTSYLQRKLRIGYSRAARLMDLLEEQGVIGPADGSAPREVLAD